MMRAELVPSKPETAVAVKLRTAVKTAPSYLYNMELGLVPIYRLPLNAAKDSIEIPPGLQIEVHAAPVPEE
jgi:hypothetical protein